MSKDEWVEAQEHIESGDVLNEIEYKLQELRQSEQTKELADKIFDLIVKFRDDFATDLISSRADYLADMYAEDKMFREMEE